MGLVTLAWSPGSGRYSKSRRESKILKLGVPVPLTGPAGQWGSSVKCSMESLKRFFNDRGGITVKGQNYKIEMLFADDKYTVAGGRAAGEKLIYNDKVDFLVGAFGAESISGLGPFVHQRKEAGCHRRADLGSETGMALSFQGFRQQ